MKKEATTEDESSQDSKVDPIDTKTVTDNGDATIKEEPTNGEKEPEEGIHCLFNHLFCYIFYLIIYIFYRKTGSY